MPSSFQEKGWLARPSSVGNLSSHVKPFFKAAVALCLPTNRETLESRKAISQAVHLLAVCAGGIFLQDTRPWPEVLQHY